MLKPVKSIFRQMGLGLAQQHAPEMSATIHKKEKRNKHFDSKSINPALTAKETGSNKSGSDLI